ncbi:MAG: hypothetical protein AAF726_19235 [Planctomycetota bacterium]
MRSFHLLGAAASLSCLASAQVTLTEITTVDLDSTSDPMNAEFIGSNPSAVAWDGVDLYVAGINSSGANADVGIVRVTDAATAPTFGTPFGVLSTPNLRGYSGLDTKPLGFVGAAAVVASYDPGGSDPNGIAMYEGPTGIQAWAKAGRGGSGVGWDPGVPGGTAQGVGAAWTTFGSGRRALQETVTGADIWTSLDGMIIITAAGTFWRDIDFDDATGNVWLREGNNVISWERTGDNSVTNGQIVVDPTDADFVSGQNIAFLGGPDIVVYNDRPATSGGQDFFASVQFIAQDGSPLTADFGSFAPATGVGYYDFSWDAASGTLAILDFSNRNAHIFSVDVGVGTNYCMANANSTGVAASISGSGSASLANNDLVLTTVDMPLNATAYVVCSQTQGFVMNPGGSMGNLCVGGSIGRFVGGIFDSGMTGSIAANVDWTDVPQPTGNVMAMAGETWNFQTWFRDAVMGSATSNFSDGLSVTVQ